MMAKSITILDRSGCVSPNIPATSQAKNVPKRGHHFRAWCVRTHEFSKSKQSLTMNVGAQERIWQVEEKTPAHGVNSSNNASLHNVVQLGSKGHRLAKNSTLLAPIFENVGSE